MRRLGPEVCRIAHSAALTVTIASVSDARSRLRSTTMATTMRFLFDYVSPYSYLASTQIRSLGARHARAVEAVPVLLAGLLNATGARGPAEIAAKRDYMLKDVARLARALDVPIEPPATHPFNPLAPLRVTGCVEDAGARWQLVEALFRATWVQGLPVDEPDTVARVASEVGLDGPALLEQSASAEGKARLRSATEEAIAAGAFGVPTIVVDGELFWGVDSLALLERFLAGERAVDAERIERWRRVRASAIRASKS
jgi:2-hydroxychromene-2-carboxylate isomerase